MPIVAARAFSIRVVRQLVVDDPPLGRALANAAAQVTGTPAEA